MELKIEMKHSLDKINSRLNMDERKIIELEYIEININYPTPSTAPSNAFRCLDPLFLFKINYRLLKSRKYIFYFLIWWHQFQMNNLCAAKDR